MKSYLEHLCNQMRFGNGEEQATQTRTDVWISNALYWIMEVRLRRPNAIPLHLAAFWKAQNCKRKIQHVFEQLDLKRMFAYMGP